MSEPMDLSALSDWAPQLAEAFASLASDIALVLDADGVVLNVAQGGAAPMAPSAHEWVGRAWVDTVTGDTRAKVDLLLKDVRSTGFARRRELNHPSSAGPDIPVAYTAMRLGEHGPVLVVGRDLRAVAAIQQRFVDAQREMEQAYWRTRQTEARQRLLFQVANDAVMVVDAETLRIVEANPAAASMFDMTMAQLHGRAVTFGFEHRTRGAVEALLQTARSLGQPAEIRARLNGKVSATQVAATPFRIDDQMRLLVRVRPLDTPEALADGSARLARRVDAANNGIVVTDSSGRVIAANPAFLNLAQVGSEADVRGHPLHDWLAAADNSLDALIPHVRRHGIAQCPRAHVRHVGAQPTPVHVSAALLTEGDQECIGFTLSALTHSATADGLLNGALAPARASGAAAAALGLATAPAAASTTASAPAAASGGSEPRQLLGAAVERLAARLGELTLPDMLREVSAVVERHALQSAARECSDDAALARTLGISRASLNRRRRKLAARRSAPGPNTSSGRET